MIGPLEILANVVTTLAIVLAGRNSVHTWWTGIVGCSLFALLFFQSKLYADMLLQSFFIVSSAIGWWQWTRGNRGRALPISHADFASLLWTVPVGIGATIADGALLHYFTDAYMPFVDSAVLVFSIIAQILMMQRRIENWSFWMLVNCISVPMYVSRGLYLTALLYVFYLGNAVVSWLWWRRLAREETAARAVQCAI